MTRLVRHPPFKSSDAVKWFGKYNQSDDLICIWLETEPLATGARLPALGLHHFVTVATGFWDRIQNGKRTVRSLPPALAHRQTAAD